METITGYVANIIYRNAENAYTVFTVMVDGEEMTCTGTIPVISEGESCKVTGDYTEHPVYGRQMKAATYETVAPQDRDAVFRYLSSGAIKGIGETLATRIIKQFGDDTMRILDEEPERLAEVRGISERGAREIAVQIEDKRDTRDAMMFLQQYGITNRQALRIWNAYGMDIYPILKEDPYRLAEDIDGIGFLRADEIARRAGIRQDSDVRIRSGLLYALNEAAGEGSCYLPEDILLARAQELLGVPAEPAQVQLENLAMDRRVRILMRGDVPQVYPMRAYRTEQDIARRLHDLDTLPAATHTHDEILQRIRHIEEHEDIHLDDLQREAVCSAAEKGIVIISGGPGTGKTTTINTIIRYFLSDAQAVLLAAPTGRAAKRMSEATGHEAMTIHRLLGYKAGGDEESTRAGWAYSRDEDDPLDADAIIIDEMSMVDMYLFLALLKAVRRGTRLILVGDVHQLPSVGPGRVLADLMESHAFTTVVLQKVFRQAAESDIVMNAHRILRGEQLPLDNKSRDFFFLERSDPNVIYKHSVQLIRQMLPGYVGCDPAEIQVLTPMRKGVLGANRLNEVLQSVLNPPAPGKAEYAAHDVTFRVGDKVMQTRNNYQIEWNVPGNFGIPLESGTGIFNGDFGVIQSIDTRLQEMEIVFDDNRVVRYAFRDLEDLEPAYAITVHKSQGSEYPAVILPLLAGPNTLMNRNLLYTAVTRARKGVVILGSRKALEDMIRNTKESTRYTGLRDRIHELYPSISADSGDGPSISEALPHL